MALTIHTIQGLAIPYLTSSLFSHPLLHIFFLLAKLGGATVNGVDGAGLPISLATKRCGQFPRNKTYKANLRGRFCKSMTFTEQAIFFYSDLAGANLKGANFLDATSKEPT